MNVTTDTLFSMLEITAGLQLDILNVRLRALGYNKNKQFHTIQNEITDPKAISSDMIYLIDHHRSIMRYND